VQGRVADWVASSPVAAGKQPAVSPAPSPAKLAGHVSPGAKESGKKAPSDGSASEDDGDGSTTDAGPGSEDGEDSKVGLNHVIDLQPPADCLSGILQGQQHNRLA
jgi:hypothetical protein